MAAGFGLVAANSVALAQNGASSLSFNMGGISRNIGSTVDFTLPTTGGIVTTSGSANTILIGQGMPFATVGGVDWAAMDAGNSNIVAGSSISGFYTPSTASTLTNNADVASGVDTTLLASPTITSLRFNVPEARTITINGATRLGGVSILVTTNVGNHLSTINATSGGRLRGGNDLVIIQNNTRNGLTITAEIMLGGALTKSGPGLLTLAGVNTYTSPSYLNAGIVSISSNVNLGAPATGATIYFFGGTLQATTTFSLDNGGANARAVAVGPGGGTFDIVSGKTLTVPGTISDNSSYGSGSLTVGVGSDTGTLALSAINTYTGPTAVSAGTLAVNGGVVSAVTIGSNAVLTGTGWITVTNGPAAVTVGGGGVLDPGTVGGVGTLTVTGNVAFASGSLFQVQGNASTVDLLVVSGNVTAASSPVSVNITAVKTGHWKIMTAANIAPAFTTVAPGMVLKKRNNDTELWIYDTPGTAIVVR